MQEEGPRSSASKRKEEREARSLWNSGAKGRAKDSRRNCLEERVIGESGRGWDGRAARRSPPVSAVAAKSQLGAEESFSVARLEADPEV